MGKRTKPAPPPIRLEVVMDQDAPVGDLIKAAAALLLERAGGQVTTAEARPIGDRPKRRRRR
jgi:hypothetical protein